jgi:hypothetical protein
LAVPNEVAKQPLSAGEARALVDQIKAGLNTVRWQVYRLYEGEGWRALGYASWRDCVLAEFPQSRPQLYRLASPF